MSVGYPASLICAEKALTVCILELDRADISMHHQKPYVAVITAQYVYYFTTVLHNVYYCYPKYLSFLCIIRETCLSFLLCQMALALLSRSCKNPLAFQSSLGTHPVVRQRCNGLAIIPNYSHYRVLKAFFKTEICDCFPTHPVQMMGIKLHTHEMLECFLYG